MPRIPIEVIYIDIYYMKKYHYVYSIVNKENGMSYIGVRSSDVKPHQDLGINYFSSSSDSNFINEQLQNRDRFEYVVIKVFDNREDALGLEIELHKKYEVGKNELFYNKSRQTSTKFNYDISGDSDIGRKISNALKGKPAHNLGMKQSDETKLKRSESLKGRTSPMKNRTHTEETKRKMSGAHKGKTIKQKIIKCPHCDTEGGSSNMKRYHFNNCELKN